VATRKHARKGSFGSGIASDLALVILFLVVVILVSTFVHQFGVPSRDRPTSMQTPPAKAVLIPGLNDAYYIPGLADRFASYKKPSVACEQWNRLQDVIKEGLAFVDAKVVPKCASPSFVRLAKAAHRRQAKANQRYGQSAYELGSPGVSWAYTGDSYTCDYLTKLTAYDYSSPLIPKDGEYSSKLTSAERQEWQAVHNWQYQSADYVQQIYEYGGNFPSRCYLPAVVFGTNNRTYGITSISFFPNHPVHSLRESAAPVFFSPDGSTMKGVGKRYVVKPGDNPSSVAAAYYGFDGWSNWSLIVAANQLAVPGPPGDANLTVNKWYPGLVIYLPSQS
jgi:hypothetical protein